MKKETPATRLRRDNNYYKQELEANAKRSRLNKYHQDPKRREQIYRLKAEYFKVTGINKKRRLWTDEEIDFLRENYKQLRALDIAVILDRSWSSIHHKLERLGLRSYNKWLKVNSH